MKFSPYDSSMSLVFCGLSFTQKF